MWVDQETDEDLVNFAGIAKTITQLILVPHLTPLTVGIHGDWGYGKSSVLRMVESELRAQERVLTLYFSGWAFEGFEDAKVALMDSIISELARKRPIFEKAKGELIALARRVRWFKVARKVAGIAMTVTTGVPDPTAVLDALTGEKSDDDLLKEAEEQAPYRHIHQFRDEFRQFLERAEIDRLVVFVDDLDRCLPEDAIATLEAIRLFLSVKGSTFVIGADEAMIEYAVRRHFPDLARSSGAVVSSRATSFTKNYLEKLIQLPFRLPQLTVTETRRYITLLLVQDALRTIPGAFDKVLTSVRKSDAQPWTEPDLDALVFDGMMGIEIPHGAREAVKERLQLANQIARPLADRYVGNPRQVKRFLNTLMLRLHVASAYSFGELVQLSALAKLMVLERRNAEAYGRLSAIVASAKNGVAVDLAALETSLGQDRGKTNGVALEEKIEAILGKADSEQLHDWLLLDPPLGGLDLRPYFFVSRERLVDFIGGESLPDELQELVEVIASGKKFAAAGAASKIASLNREQAGAILDVIFERVREGDFRREPDEFKTLNYLVAPRPDLQMRVVSFFESLPLSQLGIWAPARIVALASDASVTSAVQKLLKRWLSESDNAAFGKAVESAIGLGR